MQTLSLTMPDTAPDWPHDLCGCGKPLHYSEPGLQQLVEGFVERHGPLVATVSDDRQFGYWVPRHFVVLHNLTDANLAEFGERFGWPKYEGLRRW